MIGALRGKVLIKQPPDLLLDVQGVAYEVQASLNTFSMLPLEADTDILLYTHLIVREDAQTLFAFANLQERGLFRQLLRVNGIGPKMALTIISGMSLDEFRQCVHNNDTQALSRIPGIGKKTAERLIIEMRDRLPMGTTSTEQAGNTHTSLDAHTQSAYSIADEALNALIALGYKPAQANKMLASFKTQPLSVEEMIRQALRSSL